MTEQAIPAPVDSQPTSSVDAPKDALNISALPSDGRRLIQAHDELLAGLRRGDITMKWVQVPVEESSARS